MNKILLAFLALCSVGGLYAQEGLQLSRMNVNAVLATEASSLKAQIRASSADTLDLGLAGIQDDFSSPGPYPDTTLWLDNFVYINNDFAKAPITVGIATFDGLDFTGIPYNWLVPTTSSTIADYLTSKPIDLSVIPATDTTVYLSFFYQRQGLGNDPESHDSLVVEFRAPGGSWENQWAVKGTGLPLADSTWKYVILPVRGAFLQKGFQFRFYNYATLLGNLDHWHLDYVFLNKNRTVNDTLFEDVAFTHDPASLITTYTAIPWSHYNTSLTKPTMDLSVRNNSNGVRNVDFIHRVLDGAGTPVYTSTLVSDNVDPFSTSGIYTYAAGGLPVLPPMTAATEYTFEAILNTSPDREKKNDTIRRTQSFSNFYAYDDGSAESALGAYSTSANVDLAQRFTITTSDTLQYIDIFFNPIVSNASFYTFRLAVWSVSGSAPGPNLFLNATEQVPAYYGTGNNVFVRYPLSSPKYLTAGDYFIGFHQDDNWYLNVGLDLSSNTQDKVYYNTSGAWYSSPFPGSLMLRPVFGNSADFVGVDENINESKVELFPNPASEEFSFRHPKFGSGAVNYQIHDLGGRLIANGSTDEQLVNVSAIGSGIYFVTLQQGETYSTAKLVITR
jgi:hypothetical protein